MKYIIICLLFILSYNIKAQNQPKENNCNIELSKKDIISKGFDNYCAYLKNQTIVSFQFKVPGYKTAKVDGNTFDDKASELISKAKIGDQIVIFNIKTKSDKSIPPLILTVKK